MGYWADRASAAIARVHATLADTVTLQERMAAVDAAYPFGERAMTPYKEWLKVRRAYLGKFGYRGARPALTALEVAMQRNPGCYGGGETNT